MKNFKAIIVVILFALCLGCSSDTGLDETQGTTRVTLNLGSPRSEKLSAQSIPSTVSKIRVTVSGSGMTVIKKTFDVVGQTTITATLYVPIGTERKFLVEALSSSDTVLYSGSKIADISGATMALEIGLSADLSGYIGAAILALEAQDADTANATFEAAYALSPSSSDANFGIAITDLLLVVEDPAVVSAFTSFGETAPTVKEIMQGGTCSTEIIDGCTMETCTIGSIVISEDKICSPSKPSFSSPEEEPNSDDSFLASIFKKLSGGESTTLTKTPLELQKTIPAGAMSVPELQALLENTVLPVIEASISKLRLVQGKRYTFTITPAMTNYNLESNIKLDDGEFYALDAALCALKAAIKTVTAYNLDVDYNIMEADPLSALYGPTGGWATDTGISANFLTLKADGLTKLDVALTALRQAVDRLDLGYNFIKSLDIDQATDNGIDFTSWTAEEHTSAQNALDAAQVALSGPVRVTYDQPGNGTVIVTLTDTPFGGSTFITETDTVADTITRTMSFDVDLTKASTNPLSRTHLPSLNYDLPPDWVLSDQTYNEPVNKYVGPGFDNIQGTDDDDVVYSDIIPTTDLPDWTLNGIFPSGLTSSVPEFGGLLASNYSKELVDRAYYSWDEALTTDGTFLYTYSQSTNEIMVINATTGTASTYITLDSSMEADTISEIYDLAYDGFNIWASGSYYDGFSYVNGVFIIDPGIGKATSPMQTDTNTPVWGLTSDGTNLFGILHYHTNIVFDEFGSEISHDCNDALVKVPIGAGVVNTSHIIMDDVYSDGLASDGTFVWADGLRIDTSTTPVSIVDFYLGAEDASAYLNGYLYTMDYGKLRVSMDPNLPQ